MSTKARLQPGDLWIIAGMLMALGGAILLPVVLFGQMPEFSRLKSDGLVVQATIAGKQTSVQASPRRRQAGTSENFYFDVVFDPARGVRFGQHASPRDLAAPAAKPRTGAEIVAGLGPGKSAALPSGSSARARVNAGSFERFDTHQTGDAISVTYLAADPAGAKLTEIVEGHNPWPGLLGGTCLLIGGIGLGLAGWRRRKRALGG